MDGWRPAWIKELTNNGMNKCRNGRTDERETE